MPARQDHEVGSMQEAQCTAGNAKAYIQAIFSGYFPIYDDLSNGIQAGCLAYSSQTKKKGSLSDTLD